MAAESQDVAASEPCCRIGVIADVQYCDIEDGWDFFKVERRCYRGALECFRAACDWWNAGPTLNVLAQLGDIIDGQCQKLDREECLERCLNVLHDVRCPLVVNLIGNHELYNFSRDTTAELLGTRRDGKDYYSCLATTGIRLVVLHGYELALLGYPKGHAKYDAAMEMLKVFNPNDLEKPCDWTKDLEVRHFMPFNGAFGKEQLAWFQAELLDAERSGEKVIVLSHVLLAPPNRSEEDGENFKGVTTMAFDWEDFAAAIASRAGVVLMVLTGHDHKGRYTCRDGVHHLTFKSPLNKGASGSAYGRIDVYTDRLEVQGKRLEDFLSSTAFEGRELRAVRAAEAGGGGEEESLSFFYPEGVCIGGPAVTTSDKTQEEHTELAQ